MSEEVRNSSLGGQSTESDLPVFEGISPEIVAQLIAEEEEKVPESGTAEDGGGGRPGQAEKSVPLTALHEERARRKELQERLDTIQQERDELARLQLDVLKRLQLQPQFSQPRQEVPADPLEELIERKLSQKLKPVEERIHASDAMRETEARIAAAETAAKQKYPDYDDVTAPVMTWMAEQAKAAEKGDVRARQAMGFILGQPNPAEAAYTMGARFKYEQMARKQNAVPETGASVSSVVSAAGNNNNLSSEQAATIEKARAAAAFPRGTEVLGGGGKSSGLSEADLAMMSADDWLKLPAETRKKLLFGGGM